MFNIFYLGTWAATLTLIPYALVRRLSNDTIAVLVALFLMLSFPVMIMFETPNPDNVRIIQVTVP